MRIACLQTILMNYHTLLIRKIGNISQKVSSPAFVIGAIRVVERLPALHYSVDFIFLSFGRTSLCPSL